MDKPEIQSLIYSYTSNKCKYVNEVDLTYKLIFDKVLDQLINVDNITKHLHVFSDRKLVLSMILFQTKLKRYYASLIFNELLDNAKEIDMNLLKAFYNIRKILNLEYIHFNDVHEVDYITFHLKKISFTN